MPNPLTQDEENTLIIQLRSRPEAFRLLYRHYFPRVYAYVASRVTTRQDAEDLTADIFVRIVGAIGRFEPRGTGSFAAWVFRIAHNAVQQFYRVDDKQVALLDDLPELHSTDLPPDEAFLQKEQSRRLQAAVARLSPRRQEIITLRFYGGLRNQEIAAVLSLDERTVASHLCRALEDLQHQFQTEGMADE